MKTRKTKTRPKLPKTLPTKSIVPLLELLKYINGGDAHPDEMREGAREVLDDFDKKHPEVLTALCDPADYEQV